MNTRIMTSLLCLTSALAFAGTEPSDKSAKDIVAPPPDDNPLSFFNGKLVFDAQERLRFEYRDNNYDFNSKVKSLNDGDWFEQRARIGMTIAPCDYFSFYVQGQSSLELGSARPKTPGVLGAEGDNAVDLRQAYIKIGPKDFNVTIGRQILSYGDERLVGSFDWNNIGRTFDAVKVHYNTDTWSLEAFTSSVVVINKEKFDQSDFLDGNNSGRNQIFSGIYFSTTLIPIQVTDLYAFELQQEAKAGNTDFVTLGTRMKADPTKLGGFCYETEMAAQTGTVSGKDLAAFAGHWGVGYTWLDSPWKPHFGVEYNYASGDNNSKDGKVTTFQNLFPTNHPFYGTMDMFSWQNLSNPEASFSFQPAKNVLFKLDYNAFWLANTNDAWYRANGVTAVRPINPKANSFTGSELDASINWKATKNLSFQVGYDHFFAGKYLKATGANSDANFAYAQMTVNF